MNVANVGVLEIEEADDGTSALKVLELVVHAQIPVSGDALCDGKIEDDIEGGGMVQYVCMHELYILHCLYERVMYLLYVSVQ